MKTILCFLAVGMAGMLLQGCAGIKTQVQFSKQDSILDTKISGSLKAKFNKVQEFRSLLESLEYRVTEKVK